LDRVGVSFGVSRPTAIRGERKVKLAKDIEGGDELFGAHGERNRVYRVQQLPDGHLMVS